MNFKLMFLFAAVLPITVHSLSIRVDPIELCSTMQCESSRFCEPVLPETCPSGSCKAEPMCVKQNPCHWSKCGDGQECVLHKVTCVQAPCEPVSKCVPWQ